MKAGVTSTPKRTPTTALRVIAPRNTCAWQERSTLEPLASYARWQPKLSPLELTRVKRRVCWAICTFRMRNNQIGTEETTAIGTWDEYHKYRNWDRKLPFLISDSGLTFWMKTNTVLIHILHLDAVWSFNVPSSLFVVVPIERLATLRRSNFLPLFSVLCDFDSSLYIYVWDVVT